MQSQNIWLCNFCTQTTFSIPLGLILSTLCRQKMFQKICADIPGVQHRAYSKKVDVASSSLHW